MDAITKKNMGKDEACTAIETLVRPELMRMGYETVAFELSRQRESRLRVFIERQDPKNHTPISIDDCVAASRALEQILDNSPIVDSVFSGSYELEVSSPGIERPLSRPRDFDRFCNQRITVHLFRPLTADECGNPQYQEAHPKQKSVTGILLGHSPTKIQVRLDGEHSKKITELSVPMELISKAHLEPDWPNEFRERKKS